MTVVFTFSLHSYDNPSAAVIATKTYKVADLPVVPSLGMCVKVAHFRREVTKVELNPDVGVVEVTLDTMYAANPHISIFAEDIAKAGWEVHQRS